MHRGSLAIALSIGLLVGCGARTGLREDRGDGGGVGLGDDGTLDPDGGGDDDGGTIPIEGPGLGLCPSTPPSPGDACGDYTHYCHYYAAASSTCVRSAWCRYNESRKFAFEPISKCDERFAASSCDEGLPCGIVVPPLARCVVSCARACACDKATGLLRCSPLPC